MRKITKVTPFRMIGNLYFVGCKEYSSHLFVTEEGLILLDTGYEENAPLIVESIAALGFDIKDVKIILHSHGHGDHTWATPLLLKLAPDAKTYLCSLDERYLEGRFTPDCDYEDGGTVRLGSTEIRTVFTPGHTEGSYSFFFDLTENGKHYRGAMFGGAGPNQLKKDYMNRPDRNVPYLMRGKFFDSIELLLKEEVDVPVGNHTGHNHTLEKQAAMENGVAQNPFVAPDEWQAFLLGLKEKLAAIIDEESRTHFVNYAHRGAPAYCPENTMLSFYTGMYMGANGIETDVHKTKDGTLVLFHDDTLMRVTGKEGRIEDYTYGELCDFLVTNGTLSDKIPTLEDFLSHFAFRDITFAIELKGAECEKETADLIFKYGVQEKTVVTSFCIDYIEKIKAYAPTLRVSYLTSTVDDQVVERLVAIGADEICPRGTIMDKALVERMHRIGFNVRAWGIANEEMMRAVYDMGADGMTVNFPDLLTKYIKEAKI